MYRPDSEDNYHFYSKNGFFITDRLKKIAFFLQLKSSIVEVCLKLNYCSFLKFHLQAVDRRLKCFLLYLLTTSGTNVQYNVKCLAFFENSVFLSKILPPGRSILRNCRKLTDVAALLHPVFSVNVNAGEDFVGCSEKLPFEVRDSKCQWNRETTLLQLLSLRQSVRKFV